jgi:hypothetical protein
MWDDITFFIFILDICSVSVEGDDETDHQIVGCDILQEFLQL